MSTQRDEDQQPGTSELTLEDIDRAAELMFEQSKEPVEEDKRLSRPSSRTGKPTKRKPTTTKTRTSQRLASTGKETPPCDSSMEPTEPSVLPMTFKPTVVQALQPTQAVKVIQKPKKKTVVAAVPETIVEIPSVESVLSLDDGGSLDDLISAAGELVNPSGPQSVADVSIENDDAQSNAPEQEQGSCYDQLEARVKDLVEKLDNFSSVLTVEPFAAIHNVFKQSGYKNMAEAIGTLNVEPYVVSEAFMSFVRGSHSESTPQLRTELKKMWLDCWENLRSPPADLRTKHFYACIPQSVSNAVVMEHYGRACVGLAGAKLRALNYMAEDFADHVNNITHDPLVAYGVLNGPSSVLRQALPMLSLMGQLAMKVTAVSELLESVVKSSDNVLRSSVNDVTGQLASIVQTVKVMTEKIGVGDPKAVAKVLATCPTPIPHLSSVLSGPSQGIGAVCAATPAVFVQPAPPAQEKPRSNVIRAQKRKL